LRELYKVYGPVTEQGVWRIRRNEELRELYKVYGPVTEQGVWRIRRNEELRELYTAPDLVVDINRKQPEWL
jgi:hypothetical protein